MPKMVPTKKTGKSARSRRFLRTSSWPLLIIFLMTACSSTQFPGPQSMQGAMETEPLVDYRIRPGDKLQIKVLGHRGLSDVQTVGPDGKIALAMIDEVLVAGLTASQLDELLTKEYRRYLKRYSVTVIVREFSGLKVYIGGEVASPGYLSLQGNMTMLQAITARGGFRGSAEKENIVLIRKGPDSRPLAMVVDLEDVLKGKELEKDIYLMPSDIVYVPRTFIAKAGSFVDIYMRRILFLDTILEGVGYALGYRWVQKHYE